MRLKADSVDWSSNRDEFSEKLLEQSKPVIFIQNYPVVIDIYLCIGIESGHKLVYLQSDLWVPALVQIEGVADTALVDHLVDDVPVPHSEGMEMVESVFNVFVQSRGEVRPCQTKQPIRIVGCLRPQKRMA